jgi:hypothetical protein
MTSETTSGPSRVVPRIPAEAICCRCDQRLRGAPGIVFYPERASGGGIAAYRHDGECPDAPGWR